MSETALDVLYPALYDLLNNAAGRPANTSVHAFVPQNVDQPYFRVGEGIETPGKPFGGQGFRELLRVHAFSRDRGNQQCLAMIAWAAATMGGATVTLTGYGSVSLRVVDKTIGQDRDGTFHGILVVRARPIAG